MQVWEGFLTDQAVHEYTLTPRGSKANQKTKTLNLVLYTESFDMCGINRFLFFKRKSKKKIILYLVNS